MHALDYLIPEVIETIIEFPINDVKRCVVNRRCSIFCNIKEKMNLQQATGKEIFLGHLVMGEKPGFL